MNEDVTCIWK